MRRFIKLTAAQQQEVMARFTISRPYLWNVMNYVKMGPSTAAIREYALSIGGEIVERGFEANCQTEHTQEEMIQTWPAGVKLIVSKKTGWATLIVGGRVEEKYETLPIAGWGNLCARAQEISQQRLQAEPNRQPRG